MDVFAEFLPFPGLTHALKVSTRARNKVSSHSEAANFVTFSIFIFLINGALKYGG